MAANKFKHVYMLMTIRNAKTGDLSDLECAWLLLFYNQLYRRLLVKTWENDDIHQVIY